MKYFTGKIMQTAEGTVEVTKDMAKRGLPDTERLCRRRKIRPEIP